MVYKMKSSVLLNEDSSELSFILPSNQTACPCLDQIHLPNQGRSTFGECSKVVSVPTTIFGPVLQFEFLKTNLSDTAQHFHH